MKLGESDKVKVARTLRALQNARLALKQKTTDREDVAPEVCNLLLESSPAQIAELFLQLSIDKNLGDDAVKRLIEEEFAERKRKRGLEETNV